MLVVGAPVFTFQVEGHASIFDGATTLFQITDGADAAAAAPAGTSIIATMKQALAMLEELLPETKRPTPVGRTLSPPPIAADPIPVEFLLHTLAKAMPQDAALVEEAPSHSPGDAAVHADARRGQLLHHGKRRARLRRAGFRRHGARTAKRRTVCLIGDGSAMYSIQALWTAAQRKLPLTVVVINNSGYGALRSFSRVMQVRNVPGLELFGIDFVKIARPRLRGGTGGEGGRTCKRA